MVRILQDNEVEASAEQSSGNSDFKMDGPGDLPKLMLDALKDNKSGLFTTFSDNMSTVGDQMSKYEENFMDYSRESPNGLYFTIGWCVLLILILLVTCCCICQCYRVCFGSKKIQDNIGSNQVAVEQFNKDEADAFAPNFSQTTAWNQPAPDYQKPSDWNQQLSPHDIKKDETGQRSEVEMYPALPVIGGLRIVAGIAGSPKVLSPNSNNLPIGMNAFPPAFPPVGKPKQLPPLPGQFQQDSTVEVLQDDKSFNQPQSGIDYGQSYYDPKDNTHNEFSNQQLHQNLNQGGGDIIEDMDPSLSPIRNDFGKANMDNTGKGMTTFTRVKVKDYNYNLPSSTRNLISDQGDGPRYGNSDEPDYNHQPQGIFYGQGGSNTFKPLPLGPKKTQQLAPLKVKINELPQPASFSQPVQQYPEYNNDVQTNSVLPQVAQVSYAKKSKSYKTSNQVNYNQWMNPDG